MCKCIKHERKDHKMPCDIRIDNLDSSEINREILVVQGQKQERFTSFLPLTLKDFCKDPFTLL